MYCDWQKRFQSSCSSSMSCEQFFFKIWNQFIFYTSCSLNSLFTTNDISKVSRDAISLWLFATNNVSRLCFSNRNNRKSNVFRWRRIFTKHLNTFVIHCTFNWSLFHINSCILCLRGRTWCRNGKEILTDPLPFFSNL